MPRKPKPPPPKRHERTWGEGTVKQVRPGVWRAWRARNGATRPSRTFKGAGAEQRAKTWAKGDVEPAVLLLGHWLDRWLALRLPIVRPSSQRLYRRYVVSCTPLAGRPLTSITTDDLQALTNQLLGRYSWYTVRAWRSIISSALIAAVPRYLTHNPMAGVKLPAPIEQPPKAWKADEVVQLVAAANGYKHEAWLWTMLGTGIRVGESRALRWPSVDLAERTVTISQSVDSITNVEGPTKSGKTRVVDLPDEVAAVLADHRKRQRAGETYVFGQCQAGGPVNHKPLQTWLKDVVSRAGVSELPIHSLRHTYATLALEAGVPLKEVSESLGHADVAITASIYSHAIEQRRRRAANALGAVLAAKAPRRIGTQDGTRTTG